MVGCVHPCFSAFYVLFTRMNLVENYLLHIFVLRLEGTDDCQINRTSLLSIINYLSVGSEKSQNIFRKCSMHIIYTYP